MRTLTMQHNGVVTVADVTVTLDWLQSQCGGSVDAIDLTDQAGRTCSMYIYDEGKLVGAERNQPATRLARYYGAIWADDWIAGTAVVLGPLDGKGDDTELDEPTCVTMLRVLTGLAGGLPPVRVAPTFWEAAAEAVWDGIPVIAAGAPDDFRTDVPS